MNILLGIWHIPTIYPTVRMIYRSHAHNNQLAAIYLRYKAMPSLCTEQKLVKPSY